MGQDLDEEELDSLHTRLGLRLKNGGLGVYIERKYFMKDCVFCVMYVCIVYSW
jgi:hypothetical protein